MSKRRTDNDTESGTATPLDRFGFLKQEHAISPDRFSKARTTASSTDHDRYIYFLRNETTFKI